MTTPLTIEYPATTLRRQKVARTPPTCPRAGCRAWPGSWPWRSSSTRSSAPERSAATPNWPAWARLAERDQPGAEPCAFGPGHPGGHSVLTSYAPWPRPDFATSCPANHLDSVMETATSPLAKAAAADQSGQTGTRSHF